MAYLSTFVTLVSLITFLVLRIFFLSSILNLQYTTKIYKLPPYWLYPKQIHYLLNLLNFNTHYKIKTNSHVTVNPSIHTCLQYTFNFYLWEIDNLWINCVIWLAEKMKLYNREKVYERYFYRYRQVLRTLRDEANFKSTIIHFINAST